MNFWYVPWFILPYLLLAFILVKQHKKAIVPIFFLNLSTGPFFIYLFT